MRRREALAGLALALAGCGRRPEPAPTPASEPAPLTALDPWLRAEAAAGRFSGAVLVSRGGRTLYRGAHGPADKASGELLTPEHRFRIASLSKQFTAAAVLRLQDQGVLSVDDRLSRWIDPCPEAWRAIALHHLLSHQSGLPDLMSRADWGRLRWRSWTSDELLEDAKRLPLDFPPGTDAVYSNTAFNVLGSVVERAAGRPFHEQLRADLLDPLGLADTGYDDETAALATGHDGSVPRRRSGASVVFAAGGLYSTVDDLDRWTRALHGGRVISERSHRQMIAADAARRYGSVVRGTPQTFGYGLFVGSPGLRVVPGFPHTQIFHTGSWSGFRAYATWQPDAKLAVTALSNDFSLSSGTSLAAQRALAEALGRAIPNRSTRAVSGAPAPTTPPGDRARTGTGSSPP